MGGALSQISRGWWYTFAIGLLFHPIANLASRVGVANYEAHPIAYTCVITLGAALGLFIVARPGPLGWETLRRYETWLYGLLNTAVFALGVAVMLYLSATETSTVLRISAVMAFVLSVLFLNHRMNRLELLCLSLMTSGIVLLLALSEVRGAALVELCSLVVLSGLAQGAQMLVVERHKTNRVATTGAQNLRVTAVVMGVSAGLMALLFLTLGWVKEYVGGGIWPALPTVHDFFNWPAFVMGTLIGVLVRAPSKYCEFYAAKMISAKYFLAVIALQPLFTALYEMSLASTGWLPMRPFTAGDWVAMALVTGGSILMAFSGIKTDKRAHKAEQEFILDSAKNKNLHQMVLATLTFCGGSLPRAAKVLGLEVPALKAIIADRQGQLQFTHSLASVIQDNFAQRVAMADPLTGLPSRLQCLTVLKTALKAKQPVAVIYLDLNKFKPINDRLGHSTGDVVLQKVAERIQKNVPKGALVARLGGDEFAIVLKGAHAPRYLEIALTLSQAIQQPMRIKGEDLAVGASLGAALAQGRTTAEALLEAADAAMYKHKQG